jgi:hypothetical protein
MKQTDYLYSSDKYYVEIDIKFIRFLIYNSSDEFIGPK